MSRHRLLLVPVLLLLGAVLDAQEPRATADSVLWRGEAVRLGTTAGLQTVEDGRLLGLGTGYRAWFDADGMRCEPALGASVAELQHLSLRAPIVTRGERELCASTPTPPERDGMTVVYRRADSIRERFEVTAAHVALSWVFDRRPAGEGDLVVRYPLDTSLPTTTRTDDGGLEFVIDGIGGVHIGAVTGIDADGKQVPGTIAVRGGFVELSLPAAFVDDARYPMVLDPFIGAQTQLSTLGMLPDVCYDRTHDRYLVVWLQQNGPSSLEVRGQLLGAFGSPIQGQFVLSTGGSCRHVRVAHLDTNGRFGVVWQQSGPGTSWSIRYAAVDGATAAVAHSLIVASSTIDEQIDPDIGCDTLAPNGSGRGFVVVWNDQAADQIRLRRLYYSSNDTLVAPVATTLWSDSAFTNYSQPAISRAGANSGDLLVTANRYSLVSQSEGVSMAVVHSDGAAPGPSMFVSASGMDIDRPEVDGYGGRWVVAWQQSASPYHEVRTQPVRLDAGTLVSGAPTSHNAPNGPFLTPSLGFTPGRTWLGCLTDSGAGAYLRVQAIDSGQCAECPDTDSFGLGAGPFEPRMHFATGASSGTPQREVTMCAWSAQGGVYAQLLRNHGLAASSSSLGGGCGGGGAQALSHPPGIGSSGVACTLSGLSPSALATVFNFSQPALPLTCGACEWTPFQVTALMPVVNHGASVTIAIPCLTALIGAQVETQWTTIDLAASPCALLPGFAVSDRLLWTIDN